LSEGGYAHPDLRLRAYYMDIPTSLAPQIPLQAYDYCAAKQ